MADPRDKAFSSERAKRRRVKTRIIRDTRAEVVRQLKLASARIQAQLAAQPSDFAQWQLPLIQQSIARTLKDLGEDMAATAAGATTQSWQGGIDLIDAPIAAGGVHIATMVPEVNPAQLMAMRTFMTGKMKDVTTAAADRINTELGLVAIGAQGPGDAIGKITRILGTTSRGRAITILRTELGRAFSTATQLRQEQAVEVMPGLRKQWRRSGKTYSRPSHDLADGQIVKVDESFKVGGISIKHPRHAAAPARHVINCGCDSLPYMADWEVMHPGAKPFSPDELGASLAKRRVNQIRATGFDTWAKNLAAGKLHARGNWEAVGEMSSRVLQFLKVRGHVPATSEIAISDRKVLHMQRDAKKRRGAALSPGTVRAVPEHLGAPQAVLWDQRAKQPTLIYVFKVRGEQRLAKLVVKISDVDRRVRHHHHNWVATGGYVQRSDLVGGNVYELIEGSL
ncbi:phage minor head protein [Magnetovibrio sp.]|uniref:phage minor head protein n=1 Tax=Magnetovibrio sp. TaxID=2024836 RepID=UPI002F92918F